MLKSSEADKICLRYAQFLPTRISLLSFVSNFASSVGSPAAPSKADKACLQFANILPLLRVCQDCAFPSGVPRFCLSLGCAKILPLPRVCQDSAFVSGVPRFCRPTLASCRRPHPEVVRKLVADAGVKRTLEETSTKRPRVQDLGLRGSPFSLLLARLAH